MTRRRYPIMGHLKLRLFDANITASKPGYLRYEILGGRSRNQSEASPGAGPEANPVANPEANPKANPEANPKVSHI